VAGKKGDIMERRKGNGNGRTEERREGKGHLLPIAHPPPKAKFCINPDVIPGW